MSAELLVALVGVGGTIAATALGYGFNALNQRRQDRRADEERLRQACKALVVATGELQGAVTAHQVHWLSPHRKLMTGALFAAEFAAGHERGKNLHGLAAGMHAISRWSDAADAAERTNTIPSMARLLDAAADVAMLADEDLAQAAGELLEAAFEAAGAVGGTASRKRKAKERLDAAYEAFGRAQRIARR